VNGILIDLVGGWERIQQRAKIWGFWRICMFISLLLVNLIWGGNCFYTCFYHSFVSKQYIADSYISIYSLCMCTYMNALAWLNFSEYLITFKIIKWWRRVLSVAVLLCLLLALPIRNLEFQLVDLSLFSLLWKLCDHSFISIPAGRHFDLTTLQFFWNNWQILFGCCLRFDFIAIFFVWSWSA
jgi:hypothetical protein